MSRKHYVEAASIISRISNPTTRETVANEFAIMFRQDNSRFDRAKFLEACGL